LRAILQVLTGPYAGRKHWLRAGQITQIGRGEGSDFPLPHDGTMSRLHFTLECDYTTCRVRDQNSAHGTFLNGDRVHLSLLKDGDEIMAGETTFAVRIEGVGDGSSTNLGDAQSTGELVKVTAATAAEVAALIAFADEPRALLKPGLTPKQYLDELEAQKLFDEAIQFLSHALPKREAIWWACQCARSPDAPPASEIDKVALAAAVKWVEDPSDENRRAVDEPAQATGLATAAGLAAMAVLFSGGSLGPAEYPPIPPDEKLTPQMVASSVHVGSMHEPETAPEKQKQFLVLGRDIARGAKLWEGAGKTS